MKEKRLAFILSEASKRVFQGLSLPLAQGSQNLVCFPGEDDLDDLDVSDELNNECDDESAL